MTSNLKREFIFGGVSILILSIILSFHVVNYSKNSANLSNFPNSPSIGSETILTFPEISKHNGPRDCFIIIENKVYNVSDFLSRHPGGESLITPYCGKDATLPFQTKGGKGTHSPTALRILGMIYIGDLNGKVTKQPDTNALKSVQVGESEEGGENDD